jgi:hypothetical protein
MMEAFETISMLMLYLCITLAMKIYSSPSTTTVWRPCDISFGSCEVTGKRIRRPPAARRVASTPPFLLPGQLPAQLRPGFRHC